MPRGFAGEDFIEREAIRDFERRMAAMPSAPMSIDPVAARAAADAVQLNLSRAPSYGGGGSEPFDRQEEAFSGGAVMGPTFAPPLMFGEDVNVRGPRAPGQAVYPIAYNTFTPGQRGALNEYLLAGPGKDFSFGLAPALMGLLGAKTKYEQLSSGDYRPVFVGDQLYGSFGEGPFGGLVYTGRPLPSDVAAEYGIPGFEPEERDEVVPTVTDPVTMEQKCPDGYIFDEDLQACRLETTAPVAAPLEARSPTRTYSLLDQAPDGLLEFQRRYGLPQQQTDFSLLT